MQSRYSQQPIRNAEADTSTSFSDNCSIFLKVDYSREELRRVLLLARYLEGNNLS